MGCDDDSYDAYVDNLISIHAPIVGCDTIKLSDTAQVGISIHAPIVGCDLYHSLKMQLV